MLGALEDLFGLEEDLSVVDSCRTARAALEAVREFVPDVLLLELRLPDVDGIELVRQVGAAKLPTRCVLFTGEVDEGVAVEALRAGVWGVLLKEMPATSVVQCVRKVAAGDRWVERRSVAQAFDRLMRDADDAREVAAALTPREVEIARLIGKGLRNKEMAAALGISEQTVKVHLGRIYRKLSVDGRLALMRWAAQRGLA